ncbi:tetratricopeptide repeat protein [Vogesella sp. LIG4]|uniref:tetratricopeptide repeat protein n=1 Tax=Vogesella sp. LIG4 TaxID=1192162 RepID=UPI00081FEE32|nr:tetratricopeptide repeat protein [Vogesella sp. LIG4]SCK09634.1 Tetratricopeptide repeat-containing protein [Vogesella sp. LIG4]
MNALFRLFAVLTPLALSACASLPHAAPAANAQASKAASAAADDAPPRDEDNPAIPHQQLRAEWLYGLLAGEMAARNGAAPQAAETYIALARESRDPRIARRAAEFAMFAGQLQSATTALSLWLELEPTADTAREQLIIALLRGGKLAESRPLIEAELARQPQRAAGVFVQLARLAAVQSDKQGAETLVSELAARYPDLPEAHFALIAVAAEAGDQPTVDSGFAQLARTAPQWDLPVLWQVDRLRRQSAADAISFLKQELARRPQSSIELNTSYIRLLAGEKRFAEAEAHAASIESRFANNGELLYLHGLLAYQTGELPQARKLLEAALRAGYSDSNTLRFTLGQLADELKQPAEARRWYMQVDGGDSLLQARVRAAQIQAADGQWREAIDSLNNLAEQQADSERIAEAQAMLARDAKQYDAALGILGGALKQDPEQTDLLYERALLLDQLGRSAEAEQDLRTVVRLKPDDVQGLNALGYVMANRGVQLKEAQSYIQRALKAEPDNAMILDSLGWVLFKQGLASEALPHLQASYARLPDAEVAAHLGEVLWSLGRKDEARHVWDEARKSAPDHPVLKETLDRIKP